MKTIVVMRRSDDWHASIQGEEGKWGCGKTRQEAIGDLIMSHPSDLGIQVSYYIPTTEAKKP